jgi:hypothetical protein
MQSTNGYNHPKSKRLEISAALNSNETDGVKKKG